MKKYNILMTSDKRDKKSKIDVFQKHLNKHGDLEELRKKLSIEEIAKNLHEGYSVVFANFEARAKYRREEFIINKQQIALDFDGFKTIENFLNIAKISKLMPNILHTSSSHLKDGKTEKFRAIYFLDTPINEKNLYIYNVELLVEKLGLNFEKHKMPLIDGVRKKVITKEGIDPASKKMNQIMYGDCKEETKENPKIVEVYLEKEIIVKPMPKKYKEKIRKYKEKIRKNTFNTVRALKGDENTILDYPIIKSFLEGDKENFGGTGSGTYGNYLEVAYNLKAFNMLHIFFDGLKSFDRDIESFKSIESRTCYLSPELLAWLKDNTTKIPVLNKERITDDNGTVILEYVINEVIKRIDDILEGISNNNFYCVETKIWKLATPRAFKSILSKFLKKEYSYTAHTSVLKEIIAQLEIENLLDLNDIQLLPSREIGIYAIGFNDGTLIVDINNKTKDFRRADLSKEYNSVIRIPYNYDEILNYKEESSYVMNTISKMVDEKDISNFKMYLGTLLIPQLEIHKVLFLIGRQGREGKGSLFEAILIVLGKDKVSTLNIGQWGSNHRNISFVGSYLNISSEVSADRLGLDSEIFKSILGGDYLDINPKGETGFKYKPFMRHLLSANKEFQARGIDPATLDRLINIEIHKPYKGAVDFTYKEKLNKDIKGIFFLLLSGLNLFLENELSFDEEANKRHNSIIVKNNNQYYEVLTEKLRIDKNCRTKKSEFLREYKNLLENFYFFKGKTDSATLNKRLIEFCKLQGHTLEIPKLNGLHYYKSITF